MVTAMDNGGDYGETRSTASQKSTRSASRSSVLERARAYSRKMENGEDPPPSQGTPTSGTTAARSPSSGRGAGADRGNRPATRERAMASVRADHPAPSHTPRSSNSTNNRSTKSPRSNSKQRQLQQQASPAEESQQQQGDAVVTPELLVDALSGHEDGLLAIAERLMEHYDSGYDVMGEAIIDAFADVQKLFQHVVEAAHMEGAAFEASRREEEMTELRKQAAAAVNGDAVDVDNLLAGGLASPVAGASPNAGGANAANNNPNRHDEFIDQDVKDVLNEAIRNGAPLRDADNYAECYQLYEAACQSASALLPVDSDHRGRLQLSIARAESMSADRACAILRYAMDDVLRSGLRATQLQRQPVDVSKRGDCVLDKPKDYPSLRGGANHQAGVVQSSEEALASLVEEMKEVLNAPIYDNTPLQSVAERFWNALGEAQRSNTKTNERLEQNLGKLKGEFLLARAEWEEKLNSAQETSEAYKRKYQQLRETQKGEQYMDQARSANLAAMAANAAANASDTSNDNDRGSSTGSGLGNFAESLRDISLDSIRTNKTVKSTAGSVASLSSGLAQGAKTIASTFSCGGSGPTSGTQGSGGSNGNDPDSSRMPYRRSRSENVPRTTSSNKLPTNPPPPHNSQSYDLAHQGRTSSSRSRSSSRNRSNSKDRRSTKSSTFTRLEQEV
mmetsp:Transcript_7415/g.10516  ORF Transcript_7415/g.10516 Transcript_7415/m.10516 type:complete len:676 (-) Transcript_7415:247-2274(-)